MINDLNNYLSRYFVPLKARDLLLVITFLRAFLFSSILSYLIENSKCKKQLNF